MVSLRSIVTGAAALMAAPIMAALTPDQIVSGTRELTAKSQALQAPAQSITLINAPLIVIGQGPFPQIIAGFVDIVQTATVMIGQQPNTPPVTDAADADAIFDAFREFVRVHQVLLNILIGKAGILQKLPLVGQPVATVLRQVEGVVDAIAIFLIDRVQSRAADLQGQANSLGGSLEVCIQKYDDLLSGLNKRSDAPIDAVKRDARVFVA